MDILLIQETQKMDINKISNWLNKIGYTIYPNVANVSERRRYDGTAIMVKNSLKDEILRDFVIYEYRVQCVYIKIEKLPHCNFQYLQRIREPWGRKD